MELPDIERLREIVNSQLDKTQKMDALVDLQ